VGLSILVFFAGFYFLKGSNLFSSANNYYAYYDNVAGLQPSAPVQIRGLQVGKVSDIELNGAGRVKVTFEMDSKYTLPQGSVAKLASSDLLGSKVVRMELGAGGGQIPDGATLRGEIEGGVLDQVSSEITPLVKTIQGVALRLDTALMNVNGILNSENQRRLNHAVVGLDATVSNFSQLSGELNRQRGTITKIVQNADKITGNLAANSGDIDRIINNLDGTTKQLSNAPIEKTFNDLQATVGELRGVMDKINRGEGSLGALLTDKSLYYRLDTTLSTFSTLADDINKHPSRYINLTIFGRRAKTAQEMGTQR
jgi:phospholipid/cholesterol/gamma-HCH transport system substrate-binding protein